MELLVMCGVMLLIQLGGTLDFAMKFKGNIDNINQGGAVKMECEWQIAIDNIKTVLWYRQTSNCRTNLLWTHISSKTNEAALGFEQKFWQDTQQTYLRRHKLILKNTAKSDEGTYWCTLTFDGRTLTSSKQSLTVTVPDGQTPEPFVCITTTTTTSTTTTTTNKPTTTTTTTTTTTPTTTTTTTQPSTTTTPSPSPSEVTSETVASGTERQGNNGEGSSVPVAAIGGAGAGLVVIIVAVVLAVLLVLKRRKRKQSEEAADVTDKKTIVNKTPPPPHDGDKADGYSTINETDNSTKITSAPTVSYYNIKATTNQDLNKDVRDSGVEAGYAEINMPEPLGQEPKSQESKGQEQNGQAPKGQETKGQEPKGQEQNGQEPKGQEPKGQGRVKNLEEQKEETKANVTHVKKEKRASPDGKENVQLNSKAQDKREKPVKPTKPKPKPKVAKGKTVDKEDGMPAQVYSKVNKTESKENMKEHKEEPEYSDVQMTTTPVKITQEDSTADLPEYAQVNKDRNRHGQGSIPESGDHDDSLYAQVVGSSVAPGEVELQPGKQEEIEPSLYYAVEFKKHPQKEESDSD